METIDSMAQTRELSPAELEMLSECENTIRENLHAAIAFAEAMGAIRDHRLYRGQFATFEDYCQEKWELTARSVRRLISQAQVWRNLAGYTGSTWTVPASPSLVRPLIGLPPELQREAWREVVDTAPQGRPTVKHAEKIVGEFRARNGLPGAAMPTAPPPAAAPEIKPERPVVDVKPVGDREEQLEHATDRALDEMRALRELIGTADSVSATDVIHIVEKLEAFKLHLERVREMQGARV